MNSLKPMEPFIRGVDFSRIKMSFCFFQPFMRSQILLKIYLGHRLNAPKYIMGRKNKALSKNGHLQISNICVNSSEVEDSN